MKRIILILNILFALTSCVKEEQIVPSYQQEHAQIINVDLTINRANDFDNTKATEETWFYRMDMPEGYKNFSKTKPMRLEHFEPVMEWWNNRETIEVDGFDKAKKYSVQEIVEKNYNIDLCGFPHEEEEILPPKDLIQQYQEKRASLNADIDRILEQITGILGISFEEEE